MRRGLIPVPLLVVVVSGLLVLGLAPAAATQDATGEKVLRIEWGSYPDTLDPQRLTDIDEAPIVGLGFEGLTRIDEELITVPAAAESWEFSPDGLTLTFHLRDGLVYSDGSPLTAERFRYTIERICDPRTESPVVNTLFVVVGCEAFFTSLGQSSTGGDGTPVDATANAAYETARANLGVRAVDGQTLEIHLIQPAVYLPTAASVTAFFPAKRELIDAGGAEWWRDPANLIGNGPFVIEDIGSAEDIPSMMVFTANERYWGGRPRLDRIEYLMANEPKTGAERLAAYTRGEVDMINLAEEEFAAVEADPALSRDLVRTPIGATIHLDFNLSRAPFTDKKVREAFAYGFDRESYCREILFSLCAPTLSWIPPGVRGHIETDAYAFDPRQARQALAASSYGGPEGLPEVIWYYGESSGENLLEAEWLAAQYRAVLGIELTLVPLADDEWDPLFEDPTTRPQLSRNGWFQDYPDPQYWLSVVWTCNSVYNQLGYCNPEFDSVTAQADAELDPETRIALYEEAGRMLVGDVPSIFLYNWMDVGLVKPSVTGYATTAIDYWPGWTTPLTIDVARPE